MQNKIKYYLVLLLVSSISCQQNYTVEEQRTATIVQQLASDDLKGRYALSDEIKRAENIIAEEFEAAGLATYGDSDDYFQTFEIIESTIQATKLTIDGAVVQSSDILAFTSSEIFESSTDNYSVFIINEEDNFREKFNAFRELNKDAIILTHPNHEDIFNRYVGFFSRPNRVLNNQNKFNHLFVLHTTEYQSIDFSVSSDLKYQSLSNVIGVIDGKRNDEFVIFSAHHDHIGIQTAIFADSIGNGANDNASGVAGVIQLAHHFASQPKPERTLLFVTFTAEEIGGYGSEYFSKNLNPNEIIAMLNFEMIGKPAVSGPNTAWITGHDRSSLGEILTMSVEGTKYEFYPDPYPNQNLFYRSDNATLARLGVPAHSISTTPIDVDSDYHQVSDEFDTINISHLNNTINAIITATKGIVSGEFTPTRVDTNLID